LLIALIGSLFLLAVLYTVFGVGMRMSALEMTAMRGMHDMPGQSLPGGWSPGYALLVFLMWWVMMVAMMLPKRGPGSA
jgi:predicted metal-binding membrane protein